MKITKKYFIGILLFLLLFFTYSCLFIKAPEVAAQGLWENQVGKDNIGQAFGETGEARDIRLIVVYVIKVFLTFIGIILLILMMWAGFKWMTAGGSEEKVREAKKQIVAAVIGVMIILLSHLLVIFLTECAFDIATGSSSWMCNP